MENNPLEIVHALEAVASRETNTRFTLDELLAMEIPDTDWIVEKLIPSGITLFTGASRSYKSFLTQDMAIAVSQGKSFLDTFPTKQSNVLIIDEENHRGILQKRYRALKAKGQLPISFYSMSGVQIDNKSDIQNIIQYCRGWQIGLVIIDSLVRVHSASENSADEMSRALRGLNAFPEAGIAVILVHHHRKQQVGSRAGFENIRGSSDIFAFVDCHIGVERDGGTITLTQDKLRTDEETGSFKVKLLKGADKSVSFVYDGALDTQKDLEDEILIAVALAQHTSVECTTAYLIAEVDGSKHQITKTLNRLVESRRLEKTAKPHNKFVYTTASNSQTISSLDAVTNEEHLAITK